MADVNEEMKAIAVYAVKSAMDRYRRELNFSEGSILALDEILKKIYWGFSGFTEDERKDGLIFETATIWGSYLGEYMRGKWGGNWIQKGPNRLLLINDVEFSPISFIYQKISNNPDCNLEDYLRETQRVLYKLEINPQQTQYVTKNISTFEKSQTIEKPLIKRSIDKQLLYKVAGVGGLLLVLIGCIVGYIIMKSSGIPAFGFTARATSTHTNTPVQVSIDIVSATPTYTQIPTSTPLPTYTPKPTLTPRPTDTLRPTDTPVPTSTETPTITPTRLKTATPTEEPSQTRVPPTNPPTSTATEVPPPTETQPPPIVVESCEVNPSSVQAGVPVSLTFVVNFSSPGYGFEAVLDPEFPGASGCSGSDDNRDGVAECDGSSGMLPDATNVDVTFITPLGDCSASYGSP